MTAARSSRISAVKLAIGQSCAAWRAYPALRREVRSLAPGPPILVTGAYRSGTTWAGAMLACPGVWYLHEPFNPRQGWWHHELAYVDCEERRPEVDRLVSGILRGKRRSALRMSHAHRWFLPVRLFPLRPRRVLIKDPSAALISEYLTRRHGMRCVVLFRHPAAVASSMVRLGWPTGRLVSGLLEDRRLVEEWLQPLVNLMERSVGKRDVFSAAVFHACITRVLEGFIRRNPESMIEVVYEEACAAPLERFRELQARLDLPYGERNRSRHEALSFPRDDGDSRPYGVTKKSADKIDEWREDVTASEIAEIRSVWERSGISRYQEACHWSESRAKRSRCRTS